MNKHSKNISRAVFTMLTVLLVAFIYGNSFADGDTSSGLSQMVTQWLNAALQWLHIPLELSNLFVRKLAHFAAYSLLGGLLTATAASWHVKPWRFTLVFIPVIIGVCISSLDEYLQTFIPGRCGCVSDVLLDMSGVVWAAAAVSLLLARRARCKAESVTPEG